MYLLYKCIPHCKMCPPPTGPAANFQALESQQVRSEEFSTTRMGHGEDVCGADGFFCDGIYIYGQYMINTWYIRYRFIRINGNWRVVGCKTNVYFVGIAVKLTLLE